MAEDWGRAVRRIMLLCVKSVSDLGVESYLCALCNTTVHKLDDRVPIESGETECSR